jgi:prostamide/prostaglandin F2alpha synthase
VQLHRAREEFDAAGVGLVLIGQATPRDAANFRRQFGVELPVLADKDRVSYKAMGLKVGSVAQLVGPRVVAKGILTSARHHVRQGMTVGHPAQLGGAAVIDTDGRMVWVHRARDASDNATPDQILAPSVRERF